MAVDPVKQVELERKLDALHADFMAQFPARMEAIHSEWQAYIASADREHLVTLHRLVHSLSGTSGTFGLMDLSQVSHQLEQALNALVSGTQEADAAVHKDIDTRLVQLASHMRVESAPESEPRPAPVAEAALLEDPDVPTVLLLSGDAPLVEALSAQIEHFGYRLRSTQTPKNLLALAETVRAASIVIDTEYCAQVLWDTDTMTRIQAAQGGEAPIIVVAQKDTLQERVQAVRSGAQAYLLKPFNVPDLVDHLDQFSGGCEADPYRILVVEDDPILAERYTLLLENEGMQVTSVTDAMKIMPALVELQPDLVLMDLYMPECSGTELARVIRQQEAYVSMPIVFLSSETDMDKQFEAMSLGGDDFFTKPIVDSHLIKAVCNRAARSRKLHSLMARDSLTGLLKHTKITEALRMELSRARRQGLPLSFVMLDIDHFKRVNDTYGHLAGDHILKSLAYLLRQRLRKSDIIGRYGGEEFAIVMPDTDMAVAARVIDAVRDGFANIVHHWNGVEIRCSFSVGVAGSDHYSEADDLVNAADNALYDAKDAGRNRVSVDAVGH